MTQTAAAAVTIIGVDCATQVKKVGLARGVWDGTAVRLTDVAQAGALAPALRDWIAPQGRTLLALDAPLGWPEALGRQLQAHAAGAPLATPPNTLFRRTTDQVVKRATGKLPLDVGADRIARTAHMALTLLADLRALTGQAIPLAWQPDFATAVAAIEVYPAGTLAARGWPSTGYKGTAGRAARDVLLQRLAGVIDLACDTAGLATNDDLLDAAVAVLAGADFLRGDVIHPSDLTLARKEGWIWVSPPADVAQSKGSEP